MKRVLVIILLAFSFAASAQTQGKWSLGVGATPSFQGGTTLGLYANRHLSDHWEVGVIPFTWLNKNKDFYNEKIFSLGFNLNTRYTLINSKIFSPYLYGFGGIGHSKYSYEGTNSPPNSSFTYSNFSLGLGTRINIGSNGWSLDVNGGYIWVNGFNNGGTSRGLNYSVGIFKRF
ncbi:MAG: outer membrane beta-barrel protein [Cyclobacteriaceae bacterium]|nr:outer membrane beta-barrel protein [Cyclobacteriaceae bacterium]